MRVWLSLVLLLVSVPVHALTFYTNQATGSDSNSCTQAQTPTTAKATIGGGVGCLVDGRGDTLIIATGVYVERLNDAIPSGGGSWETATILRAAPGASVIMRPTTSTFFTPTIDIGITAVRQWIIIDGIEIDHQNVTGNCCSPLRIAQNIGQAGDGTNHIRLINSELHTTLHADLVDINPGASFTEMIDNTLRNTSGDCSPCATGNPGCHAFYANGNDMTFEGNEVYSLSGLGFQVWNSSGAPEIQRPIVRRNRLWDIPNKTSILAGFLTRDGIFSQNTCDSVLHCMKLDGQRNVAYNNTAYGSTSVAFDGACNTADCKVKNNIWDGGSVSYQPLMDQSNNNTTCTDACYTNAATGDLTLSATSIARNAGTDVGLPFNGANPDQGPYQTWSCASGVTLNDTTIELTCDTAYPPYQAPQQCATVSLGGIACGATCTTVTPQADNRLHIGTSCPMVSTDANITAQHAGPNWLDSINVGGTDQPGHLINVNVTNTLQPGGTPDTLFGGHAISGTIFR